jgi:hypothetical protein
MAQSCKPHPADVANANVIASAVRFEIALFLGGGRYATDIAETLAEARAKAARLMAMHPNGRRPLIYGVAPDGRSGLVTETHTPITEKPMKTYAKKFNAQRAAKAAGHDLDEIEIGKAKNGFTWRLKQPKRAEAKDAKLAPDPSREPQPAGKQRPLGKRAAIEAAAREGKLPEPPDFSAETHKRFRNRLANVVELAEAGDLLGLRAFEINPVSSSPKAIKRYRDICVMALEARQQAG